MSGSIAILFTAAMLVRPVMGAGNAAPSRSHWRLGAHDFALEPPLSGPGPLRDSQRRRNEAPSYTNPILKPRRETGEAALRLGAGGQAYATPSSSCCRWWRR